MSRFCQVPIKRSRHCVRVQVFEQCILLHFELVRPRKPEVEV
jgi:hypothetical protein